MPWSGRRAAAETPIGLAKDVNVEQVRTADLAGATSVGAIFNFIVGFPGRP
jgi:hypothetical protein